MAYLGRTPSQATRSRYYFTASGGETSLSGNDSNGNTLTFTDGNFVDVSLNGATLVAGSDYNTTTANTIGGLAALTASDVVEIVVYDTFSVFGGNVLGDFTISNGTLTAQAVSVSSLSTTGNITFGDNDKAIFGAGSDLQIYHDGTHSYISDVGDGPLRITTDGTGILLNKSTTESMGRFLTDGAVELYYDNAKKFETTSTGVELQNTSSGAETDILQIRNNATAASTASTIKFVNSTSSGSNSGSTELVGIRTGTNTGNFVIRTSDSSASMQERMRIDASGNVGVGTSSITSGFKLDVIGDARFSDAAGDDAVELGWSGGGSVGFVQAYDRGASAFRDLSLNNAMTIKSTGYIEAVSASQVRLTLGSEGTAGTNNANWIRGNGTSLGFNSASGGFQFEVGGTERLRISGGGSVGIGILPENAYSSYTALELGRSGSIYANGGADDVNIGNNFYLASDGNWRAKNTEMGSLLQFNDGDFRFFTAPSTTADTNISWTEKVRFQNTGGISFNGDTAADNALDDYEQGTFTPLLSGARPSGGNPTYNVQLGLYTKIGNMVEFNICVSCVASSLEVQANDLVITGLPFTNLASSSPTGQNFPTPTVWPQAGINNTSTTQGYGALIANNSTNITIYGHVSGTGYNYVNVKYNQLSTSSANNSFQIRITGTYRTAS